MSLKVNSVADYVTPEYPTSAVLEEHPELLKLVPRRWRGNPAVITAVTTLCLMSSVCRDSSAKGTAVPPRVAPIFEHGEGRGAFGCEAVNPPVFLSEAEARQVIVEEAKRAGILFVPDVPTLHGVETPITDIYAGDGRDKTRTRLSDVTLDGEDRKKHIAYEYVSQQDFGTWRGKSERMSTAYGYDIIDAARVLSNGIANVATGDRIAVFYDPMTRPTQAPPAANFEQYKAESERHRGKARNTSKEQLREQVRDFIKWLKAQGVI